LEDANKNQPKTNFFLLFTESVFNRSQCFYLEKYYDRGKLRNGRHCCLRLANKGKVFGLEK
jgi:hypothetical protein